MEKIYAKYDGDCVWEVVYDNGDGTVDLCIDDIQGDMYIGDVNKTEITIVSEDEYNNRVNYWKDILNAL